KRAARLSSSTALRQVDDCLQTMLSVPQGPAYLEVAGSTIRGAASEADAGPAPIAPPPANPAAIARARAMLAAARRPIVIAGLQARHQGVPEALRAFIDQTSCPLLYTYKAKGVVSDDHPQVLGPYIGGVAEEDAVRRADLAILVGFDPVEGPPQPWRYSLPLLEITEHRFDRPLFDAQVSVVASLPTALRAIASRATGTDWDADEIASMKNGLRAAARVAKGEGISPQDVVTEVQAAMPDDCRITVDAGAHMLPVMHLWKTRSPNGALISRGLSTMAFALPAAIAAHLADPATPTVAFTGDGGLMMCTGELATAAQFGCKPIVVVFNDSSLTLIGAKQRRRQLTTAGVNFSSTDFAQVARGFGWSGYRVTETRDLRATIGRAIEAGGPALIDVVVDPHEYQDQIVSLRG
ncbi:MAG TPA: thiamine pyrophosphate-dependent enzyme, partial [Sphingomonadaceae bacterium]|nr:thiamine pyrophosphate-dependent enzyme [Sphingomonadaceae bacterium]